MKIFASSLVLYSTQGNSSATYTPIFAVKKAMCLLNGQNHCFSGTTNNEECQCQILSCFKYYERRGLLKHHKTECYLQFRYYIHWEKRREEVKILNSINQFFPPILRTFFLSAIDVQLFVRGYCALSLLINEGISF